MRVSLTLLALLMFGRVAGAAEPALAPTGTLRAAYLVANLAQATLDPATGAITGVAADVARELGRRQAVPVRIMPMESAALLLEAVRKGDADIGFVAPNPERTGVVLYSRTYMLVQQSALVRVGGGIASVRELDRAGQVVGVNTGDSVGVWLRERLKAARLMESADGGLKEAAAWLLSGRIDAFAGNRHRLAVNTAGVAGLMLLPDNLYAVPQTVAVPLGRPDLLALVDASLEEMKRSGFLAGAVARSGVDGISVAD